MQFSGAMSLLRRVFIVVHQGHECDETRIPGGGEPEERWVVKLYVRGKMLFWKVRLWRESDNHMCTAKYLVV